MNFFVIYGQRSQHMKSLLTSFRLAIHNIRGNLFHTLLSILGVVIGVAALVTILSLIDGLEKMAHEQISKETSVENVMIRMSPYENLDGIRVKKASFTPFQATDLDPLIASLPVKEAIMMSQLRGALTHGDSGRVGVRAYAVTAPKETPTLADGQMWKEPKDHPSREALLSYATARSLREENPLALIGDSVFFGSHHWQIVGILDSTEEASQTMVFSIHWLTEEELKDHPPVVNLKAQTVEDVPTIQAQLETRMAAQFPELTSEDYSIITSERWVSQLNKGFSVFRVVMGMIIGLSVLVGGIGIMNVLLISVNDRIREIGIRKATGAKKKDIVWLFLAESITISALGSFLGLVLGMGFSLLAAPLARLIVDIPFQAAFTWNTLLIISTVAVFIGVIFGTYPAMKASRLDPVVAIRKE
jgi:putative ABC transport system permease protein